MNPRLLKTFHTPHYAIYYGGKYSVNSSRGVLNSYSNTPVLTDKIVINHYYTKSREEFELGKIPRGMVYFKNHEYVIKNFYDFDRNDVFDDGILKYRSARKKKFSLFNNADRIRRVEKSLIETLTKYAPSTAPAEFFNDKLETFLTCRAVAERLGTKIDDISVEEYALAWIYMALNVSASIKRSEIEMFIRALPEILARPFPICKRIGDFARTEIIPYFCEKLKNDTFEILDWMTRNNLIYTQKLLNLIK